MTDEPVKKSKTKAAGLALLFAFSAVVALRIHHRGDSVNTQAAAAPLSLLRAKEELNSSRDDFAHRQAKDVTKYARPFLSRKYDDSEKNKRLGNSRVSLFDQRNLQGSFSLSMMGTGDYLVNQGKGKSGKDPSKPDTSKAGKSKDDWKPASEEKEDDEWKTSKASKSKDDWKPASDEDDCPSSKASKITSKWSSSAKSSKKSWDGWWSASPTVSNAPSEAKEWAGWAGGKSGKSSKSTSTKS